MSTLGVVGISCLALMMSRGEPRTVNDPAAAAPRQTVSAPIHQPATPLDIPDPAAGGWPTEENSQLASDQLKRLAERMTQPESLSAKSLQDLISVDFSCDKLWPSTFDTEYRDELITVRRATIETDTGTRVSRAPYHGVSGMVTALQQGLAPFRRAKRRRVSFKVFHIQPTDSRHFMTRQFVSLSAHTASGMLEQNATWRIRWQQSSEVGAPKVIWAGVESLEDAALNHTSGPLFSDCTVAVLGGNDSFARQMMYGNAHWCRRLQQHLHVFPFGHHGLAVGDVNGDGLDDVYRCQPGGIPNRLYVQKPDGSATDESMGAGVDFLDNTRSALMVDLDNDGDQDMVFAFFDAVAVAENDGAGHFTVRRRIEPVPHGYSLAAADYDLDADLDFFVCVYYSEGDAASDFPVPVPYFDATNGGRNVLFRNDGDWQFRDVTDQVGLGPTNNRFSYAAAWEDYDLDGDADLYVANDFGRNNLYRNDGGQFVDVARQAGLEDSAFGMSVSFGDFNRDGQPDVYVGNMFSAAGNRVTAQRHFRSGTSRDIRSRYRRLAQGNTLYAGNGDGTFRDVSLAGGAAMGRWSWSSIFADLNNDGWEDLLVANGFITGDDPHDL